MMAYIGDSASHSLTWAGVAAAEIKNGGGLAVKFDENGKIVLCNVSGEAAIGVILLQTSNAVKAGDSLTFQLCGQGQAVAGGAIKAGDPVMADTTGKFVKATTGKSVFGIALSAATTNGFFKFNVDRTIAIS